MGLQGSCACKTVRYAVDELATPISHCHCQTCRKTHAAAFNSAAGVRPEQFRWLAGEAALSQYASSADKVRYFCSQCGSHLLAKKIGKPMWVLRVATLDDDPSLRANQHIWTSHDVPWLNFVDLPEYAQWAEPR
ncbi:GFA family protein [Deefgea salmonis]|uniref:GFA family protein n=1 Tax=Deefgea salmonis TaxID=2875502 RepID=A0ABS8BHK0_9NEIS|nr:GFA family protein [Deefgea salmonis]MCB5195191.1 GFA family protein [Deefgea salmonis]